VTARPEAEPDVSTRPINRQRPDITIRTAPAPLGQPRPEHHPRPQTVTPPRQPPQSPRVAEPHHEDIVERPSRQEPVPEFPWPPPAPSAQYVIPRELVVVPGGSDIPSLSDIVQRIEFALERAAYYDRSFYSTPGGIAMVTRLERIKRDGTPDGSKRWLDIDDRQPFSLMGYLNALLFADAGHFRLIVFIVTDRPFAAVGPPLTPQQGSQLLLQGLNMPPPSIAEKPVSVDHQVSVLIYEFEKRNNRTARQIAPSALPARVHLEKSLLWAGLRETLRK
jgi:hypothetical protein